MTTALKARGLWLALGWGLVILVAYLSLAPAPPELPLEQGDKLSHVLAYIVLMSWFANLYESPLRFRFALGFTFLAISLECLQQQTGYRTFEVTDMVAGAAGIAVGWILAPPRTPNYLSVVEKICQNHS